MAVGAHGSVLGFRAVLLGLRLAVDSDTGGLR
jgi:hypothetical protein